MKFRSSKPLTLGVELELQVIDPASGQLVDRGADLVQDLECLSAEITQAMVEYNSPVCETAAQLREVLCAARDDIAHAALNRGVAICGGGMHAFHRWPERQISEGERFQLIHERYAYLAQTFTVFGLHIHIGCRDGQDALYLTHALSRYVPHLIALAASSPFHRSIDTGFDCARLNVLAAFPTSGTAPPVRYWKELQQHVAKLKELKVAETLKDLYWDIRPKPDTGTIEIRVCDMPLTVGEAADLAAYAQLLSCDLLNTRRIAIQGDLYTAYRHNRFQACRYGFDGVISEPSFEGGETIRDGILRSLEQLWPLACKLNCSDAVTRLGECVEARANGAARLRRLTADGADYPSVLAAQVAMWAGQCSEFGEPTLSGNSV